MPEGALAKRSVRHLVGALRSQLQASWFLSATPNACAGSGECACARVCEVWIVAGLLLLMGSVLCVWRCAGVRRARAVRVCVLDPRVRLRVLRARRRCVLCAVLCCAPCL